MRYTCAVDDPIRDHAFDEGRGAEVGQRALRLNVRLWVNDRASAAWIFDVLDAYGDFPPDDLMGVSINEFLSLLEEIMARTCSIVNGCTTSLP